MALREKHRAERHEMSGGSGCMQSHPRKKSVAHSCMGKRYTSNHVYNLVKTIGFVVRGIHGFVAFMGSWPPFEQRRKK
jgi:hypothetical protein